MASRFFYILILLVYICFLFSGISMAQDEDMDEIISGFDADKAGSTELSKDETDNVLDGFDDEPQAMTHTSEDDILNGFEDDSDKTDLKKEKKQSVSPAFLSLNGYVKIGASYNFAHDKPEGNETDWRGLSRLRTDLILN